MAKESCLNCTPGAKAAVGPRTFSVQTRRGNGNWKTAFPYELTADQETRAMAEIKRDMEGRPARWIACWSATSASARPNGVRAAFKAVMDGLKQVAVLAPTTVLAMQHFETFRRGVSRLSRCRVEMISRFRTASARSK